MYVVCQNQPGCAVGVRVGLARRAEPAPRGERHHRRRAEARRGLEEEAAVHGSGRRCVRQYARAVQKNPPSFAARRLRRCLAAGLLVWAGGGKASAASGRRKGRTPRTSRVRGGRRRGSARGSAEAPTGPAQRVTPEAVERVAAAKGGPSPLPPAPALKHWRLRLGWRLRYRQRWRGCWRWCCWLVCASSTSACTSTTTSAA